MKQIIQNIKNGETLLEEVPTPLVRRGYVLIKTHRTLVSLGTEKMLVEFGKSNLINKARQQPEKVRQVLDKIRTEGLIPTLEAVFNKLDEPLPLGYCNAGEVLEVGEGVTEFKKGDRVASNGHHAEIVCVPKNLVAKIPADVTYEEAAFTVVGAIGLQGIRLVAPTLGETVVVVGLGLIGLITAELLVANGCNVIGFDYDENKVRLAAEKGIKSYNSALGNVVKKVEDLTNGIGADAVIITASTKSNTVISEAAGMSRKKGRIVLIGVIGLDLQRADFFKKELSFQVSCSYGPGRYDEQYEINGIDYPVGYIRWTEKRNFEAVLEAISSGRLDVKRLITESVTLENYHEIYRNMGGQSIASLLEFTGAAEFLTGDKILNKEVKAPVVGKGIVGIIGAGNFTKMTVLPALKLAGGYLKYITSAGGLTARSLSKKYNIRYATTDYTELLKDEEVDLVFITTRHDLHARMAIESLVAGKHVFVEKPLALNTRELEDIIQAHRNAPLLNIHVGFNRRFSPHASKAKQLLGAPHAINIIATMNAGFIPAEVWVHDMNVGGGRIVGEACHFVDLMNYLTGSEVISVHASALGENPTVNTDNAIITLKFANGSQGVINYFANGSKSYQKERVEIFSMGRTLIIDNFRRTTGYGFPGFTSLKTSIDKGHKTQFKELIRNIQTTGMPLIPFNDIVNTSKATISALESLQTGQTIYI